MNIPLSLGAMKKQPFETLHHLYDPKSASNVYENNTIFKFTIQIRTNEDDKI